MLAQLVRPQSLLNRISSLHSLVISSHSVCELSYQYLKTATRNTISRTSGITHDCLWTRVVRCLRILQRGGLSEIGKSAGKSGEQQINNLWPGRFVKVKIYEETSKEYLTIRPVARKGYGSIAHEAKPNGLLIHGLWGRRVLLFHDFMTYVVSWRMSRALWNRLSES